MVYIYERYNYNVLLIHINLNPFSYHNKIMSLEFNNSVIVCLLFDFFYILMNVLLFSCEIKYNNMQKNSYIYINRVNRKRQNINFQMEQSIIPSIVQMTSKNSQQIIQKIMYYAPPCHPGSFNGPQPLIDKYNVQQLTNILDRNKIQSIDKVYRSKQDGFNLLQFVRFFLNVIQHEQIETLYLTIALIDFFKQISQSCGYKDKIHFIDITNYICNRILQKRNSENQIQSKYIPDYRTIIPSFKIKDYLINPPRIYSNKDQLVYKLSLNKIKIDKMKHEGVVTNCYFSSSLMKVFTLDDLSDSISVYNTSCGLIKRIKPHFSKLKKDIVVLSFAYSQRQQRIGAVLKDFSINFWDNSDNFQFQKSISTASHCQQYQTNIWFFQYFNAWITSDKTGHLYVWNLQTQRPQRKIKLVSDTQINDLTVVPCINLIAVVQERKIYNQTKSPNSLKKKKELKQGESFDAIKKQNEHQSPVIYLYDFLKGEVATKIELGSQNRNPHTLQYSQNYQVLLSAGYQKKISIFQINKTFLDTNKKGELTGHQSLITSFTVLKKSPMVISADDKGKVKIWDIRNYKCVQTLDFRDKTNITKLLDMIQLGKVGVLGSRINFVQFDQKVQIQKRIHLKDKFIPLWIECDYASEELIVLTKKDIRVIDLKKGVIKNIYCQFHTEDTQITFFKYLQTLKKFIIGNEKGQIKIFCLRTGKLDSRLMDHLGSITHVQYDQQNKIFISMGQDSTIQIQKQLAQASSLQRQKLIISKQQVKQSNGKQKSYRLNKNKNDRKNESQSVSRSQSSGAINASKINTFVQGSSKENYSVNNYSSSTQDPNILLLRQMKNNFNGKQVTLGCVSIYHGFIAVGSSEKSIYIWDYQFSKLLIEINLPNKSDPNTQPTCMTFINGYSIIVIGTSDGTVYFVRITKIDQGSYNVKTIGIYRSNKEQPITNIVIDLLIKGFTPNKQKFIHCKVYIGHSTGCVTSIDLTNKLCNIKQELSVVHKQSFNAQRQLRQNFTTQIQKKKYVSYTIQPNMDDPLIGQVITVISKSKKGQSNVQKKTYSEYVQAVTFQAHKNGLTGLSILQLDQCFLISIGADERLKLWKQNNLVCDWNINLPLPFKWDLQVVNQQKKKDKIMFALKIIQQIFQKYGSDISINESKALKVRKLLDKVKWQINQDQSNKQNFITQPFNKRINVCQSQKVTLFQNQFTKKDMHYDNVKKFNFNEVAGPTLRQIQVQKKLDLIQRQWTINKQKVQQDKNKLLLTIRNRAQKNEQKQQILQFMQPRVFQFQKNTDKQTQNIQISSAPFVKNIMNKIQNIIVPKSAKKQIQNNETFGMRGAKQNYLGFTGIQKIKINVSHTRINNKLQSNHGQNQVQLQNQNQNTSKMFQSSQKYRTQQTRREKSVGFTFEKYFVQKQKQRQKHKQRQKNNENIKKEQIGAQSRSNSYTNLNKQISNLPSMQQMHNRTSNNFRNILNRMNSQIKQSKKKKVKANELGQEIDKFNQKLSQSQKHNSIDKQKYQRIFAIATSDGRRNIKFF